MKEENISPVFKRRNRGNDKSNYRLASKFPKLSKIYKRLIYNQINQTAENAFLKKVQFSQEI